MRTRTTFQHTVAGSAVLVTALLFLALTCAPTLAEEPGAPSVSAPVATPTSVDTVTVVGTPRTPYTPIAGPQVEAPGWRTSDPGIPDADTTTYSTATSSAPPVAWPRASVNPGGGRAERGNIPWWLILIGAAAIAVAAGS